MKRIHSVLLIVGGSWLALALWVVVSKVILRETRLEVVSQLLDKLPPAVGTPIFTFALGHSLTRVDCSCWIRIEAAAA